MQIVINISEQDYWLACNHPEALIGVYAQAIKKGKPIPKGHGRIIELTPQIEQELFSFTRYTGIDEYPYENATLVTDAAPTIIEADV